MKKTQTFELGEFIQERKDLTIEQRREARQRLEELSKTGLGVERLPKENLAQALANSFYAKISPEFLQSHQLTSFCIIKGLLNSGQREVRVPRFGIYSLDSPLITLELSKVSLVGDYNFRVLSPKGLPQILTEQLVFATEFGKDPHPELWHHYSGLSHRWGPSSFFGITNKKRVPKDVQIGYYLSNSFYGFIPETTKAEIREATPIFGKNLFLVAETKPEDWTLQKTPAPRIIEDPLILGVIDRKCYLVDHFDTTPVEEYARQEYTTN